MTAFRSFPVNACYLHLKPLRPIKFASNIVLLMTATIVYVYVKTENISQFIEATRLNHEASVKENGNLRFDILQDGNDPSKFVLYEAYVSEEAVAAHKETDHYKAWRDTVSAWMARPREGVKHSVLFPSLK